MESNREEAARTKSIAESKLKQKDFFGAKKLALKAQTLNPGLDGISQMLITLDVYVSAENKISGEVDWYGVLGVDHLTDDETIKRQYRKLALMLHPDKNNSIGADGAFKLISEAWRLLSDKAKRLAYNQRRGYKGFQQNVQTHSSAPSASSGPSQQKVTTHTGGPSAPSGPSQLFSSTRRTSAKKSQSIKAKAQSTPIPAPSQPRIDTFWTICRQCNVQFEYLKIYQSCFLLCPNCRKPFMASEIAPPVNLSESAKPVPWQRHKSSFNNSSCQNAYDQGRNAAAAQKPGSSQASPSSSRNANCQQGSLPRTADIGSTDPSIAAKVAHVVQHAWDTLKRRHTESHPSASQDSCFKKRKLGDDSGRCGMNYCKAKGHSGSETANAFESRSNGYFGTYHQPNGTRERRPLETQKLLIVKVQNEIKEKLSESRSETTSMAADIEKYKTKERKKENYGYNSSILGHDGNGKNELSATSIAEQAEKPWASPSADNVRKEYPEAVTMDVPDSDFHDFDLDRSESSFADNEVWAAYDEDGMPRLYALISKVISTDPFELSISWLDLKTNSECSNIGWVDSGFYKTCGEFVVGGYETCTSINAFSQRVNWSKGPHGSVVILPQKGDSWALYKNWSSGWDENTPSAVVHKYYMVMVLDDYNEEKGVSVAPLVKVAGFRTVFLPHLDSELIKRIPKEEISRFSHRVPNHFLTSQEAPNAPEGSLELDPAATPVELLQMIRGTNGISSHSK